MKHRRGNSTVGLLGIVVLLIALIVAAVIYMRSGAAGPVRGGPETWQPATRQYVEAERRIAMDHFNVGQYESARAALTALAETYPDDPATHALLAQVIYAQKDVAGAYEAIGQAIALGDGSAESQQFAGELAMMQDKVAEAREHYAAALKADPASAKAALRLANAYLRLNELDAARLTALNTLKIDPAVHQAYAILAEVAARTGDPRMAHEQMGKAIAAATKRATVQLYTLQKAKYLRRDNKPEQAMAVIKGLGPEAMLDTAVIAALAQCHLQLGEAVEAGKLWATVLAWAPMNAEAAAEAGLCFHRAGDERHARQYLAMGQRINADHPKVRSLAKRLAPKDAAP